MPLHDVAVKVRLDSPVQFVRLAPEGDTLDFDSQDFDSQDGAVSFVVPRVLGHQMVEVGFE